MSRGGRLVTGNAGHTLKLWSTAFIGECRLQNGAQESRSLASQLAPAGVTLDDEMSLDGMPVSATFDDTLDMVRLFQFVFNIHVQNVSVLFTF